MLPTYQPSMFNSYKRALKEIKMENELIKKFENEFNKLKKERGFKVTLKEMDEIFFLKDFVLQSKYIPTQLSRAIANRIVDTLNSWLGYLHGLIMPNPQNMVNLTESNLFDDKEKQEIIKIMNKILNLTSKNSLIGITKNKKQESEYFDEAVKFWKTILNTKLQEIIIKVNKYWQDKSKE